METEIENWIQKYDSEMSEKQVFVCLILSQVCFPRSSRNRGEGAGEEKPLDGPWSTPSSGPPESDFPVPSLGSRVCLAWGSEGSSDKGRKRKLPATKWRLAQDPKISAPSKVSIQALCPLLFSTLHQACQPGLICAGFKHEFTSTTSLSCPGTFYQVLEMGRVPASGGEESPDCHLEVLL